jgi:uncharacterized protein (DUF2267 family)
MGATGFSTFDKTIDKTNHVLAEIEQAHGWSKDQRNKSYDALRAVLHTLRDRLTVDECAHLAAQLPLLVRGVYYEGWDPSRVPINMNREEFLQNVRRGFPDGVAEDMERLVTSVLQALRQYVTEGEWEDIKSSISRDLRPLIPV